MQKKTDGAVLGRTVCLIQGAIAVVSALAFAAISGRPPAIAALYGGVVAVLPTYYLARRALRYRDGQTPAEMLGAFYRGEIGKIALTALLFAFGISIFAKQFLALMVTYAACLLAYWLVTVRSVSGDVTSTDRGGLS